MLRQRKTNRRFPDRRRTAAQESAWRVFRLRALWHQASLLSGERRRAVQRLIDSEILGRGAEPERKRQERRWREWDARDAAPDTFEEVAF